MGRVMRPSVVRKIVLAVGNEKVSHKRSRLLKNSGATASSVVRTKMTGRVLSRIPHIKKAPALEDPYSASCNTREA
jgi:hypothetical protein